MKPPVPTLPGQEPPPLIAANEPAAQAAPWLAGEPVVAEGASPWLPDEPALTSRRSQVPLPGHVERAGGAAFQPPGRPARLKKKTRHRTRNFILKLTLAVTLLAGCSSLSFVGARLYHLYAFAQSVTGKTLPTIAVPTHGPQPTALAGDLSRVSAFNLLLLGSDDDAKQDYTVLTETVIAVRVDLAHHKITMLSLPRDLYVPTDYGACCVKLDEISGNGDGIADVTNARLHGFAHTVAAIETNFGIPIHAYAWVGLIGFIKVIDTVGGVDVDVLHPIVDDAYPKDLDPHGDPNAYQRLYIPAGPQHLDGKTALEYVRSRHSDLAGDIGRSERQQSVLAALRKKLENPAILAHLEELANDLQGSVLTSLTIPQILWLANWAKGLPSNAIAQKVLSVPEYGRFYDAPTAGGEFKSVIQPNWPAIHATVRQIFPDAVAHVNLGQPSAEDAQTIQQEGARILIENGSGVPGLANKLSTTLKKSGFKVVGVQDADRLYLATQLQQFNSKTAGTASILGQMLGVPAQTPGIAGPQGADIVIIIGKDIANAIQQAS